MGRQRGYGVFRGTRRQRGRNRQREGGKKIQKIQKFTKDLAKDIYMGTLRFAKKAYGKVKKHFRKIKQKGGVYSLLLKPYSSSSRMNRPDFIILNNLFCL